MIIMYVKVHSYSFSLFYFPGLVEPEFYRDYGAGEFLRELKSHIKSIKAASKDEELVNGI